MLGLRAPAPERERDRVLREVEIRALWHAAEKLDPPWSGFVKWLLLYGQRLRATASMRQRDVADGWWQIPAAKQKSGDMHELPITPFAEVTLMTDTAAGDFNFSTNGRTPISGFSKLKRTLDQSMKEELGASFAPWKMHDARRVFSTSCAALGVEPFIIDLLMDHRSGSMSKVAKTYNRFRYRDAKKQAIEQWHTRLLEIVGK